MQDPDASPVPPLAPEFAAVATVGSVLSDLVEVAEVLPRVPTGEREHIARILDRLSEEIAEAAGMIRAMAGDTPSQPVPGPAFNPWGVIRLVTVELVRGRVKSRFGPEADLTVACGHAARLLDALGVTPVVPADAETGYADPMARDPRVTSARALAAEHHQPLTMTPGDVRHLLARFQRRVVELLQVIDNEPPRRESGEPA